MRRLTHTDCIHFNGYKPCRLHKIEGAICENCREYAAVGFRVLILKIGAAGEVIRNTPLLHKIKSLYADKSVEITWITDFPDFVPRSLVKRVLKYDWKNVQMLLEEEFDLLLSLDKEHNVCALANKVNAHIKKGFLLDKKGRIIPADRDAERKWLTGVFDDMMKSNTKHYVEELFEICGWEWKGEKYILEGYRVPSVKRLTHGGEPVMGLNTGAGNVWPTRIWPERSWAELISRLLKSNLRVLLLGGPEEHDKNMRLAKETGAYYEGLKSYKEFVGLMSYCDVVVTAVTMALHIAIGLEKRIVLLNNIFNKHEFFLYGLGPIVEPDVTCMACYKQAYDARCPVPDCMELISVDMVYDKIVKEAHSLPGL
jgi:heptosyltransferase-2